MGTFLSLSLYKHFFSFEAVSMKLDGLELTCRSGWPPASAPHLPLPPHLPLLPPAGIKCVHRRALQRTNSLWSTYYSLPNLIDFSGILKKNENPR